MSLLLPESLEPRLAEVVLAGGAALLFLLGKAKSLRPHLGDLVLLVLAASAVGAVVSMDAPRGPLLHGVLVVDPFAGFFKFVLSMIALVVVWVSARGKDSGDGFSPGAWCCFLLSLLAMDAAVSAVHVAALWISLEAASLAAAAWLALERGDSRSTGRAVAVMAGTGVASALLLLGFVLLFALGASLSYADLGAKLPLALAAPGGKAVMFAGVALVTSGLAARLTLETWLHPAPREAGDEKRAALDSSPAAVWLGMGFATASLAVLARFLRSVPGHPVVDGAWAVLPGVEWQGLLSVAAPALVLVGNVAALRSSDLRRLLAWLGVAQAGYLLGGLALGGDAGLAAMLFQTVAGAMALLGATAMLGPVLVAGGSAQLEIVRGLARGNRTDRLSALALALFLLSLAALPPLAGHAGRARLFGEMFAASRPLLALGLSLGSAVGLLASLRVIATMLDRPTAPREVLRMDFEAALLVALLVAGTVAVGLWPSATDALVGRSVIFFGS